MNLDPSPLRVVAAVVFDAGKVLACRRRSDKSAAGLWEFPGGKIEPDETPEDALIREISEELSVLIAVNGDLGTDVTWTGHMALQLTCFRAHLRGARPIHSTDHDQLLWLPVTELDQLEWARPDLPAVWRLMSAANTK